MENIVYDCRWTTDVDSKFIEDFIDTEKKVFHNNFSIEYFNKKYLNNPYGSSVVEVVYIEGKPEAARALWRNDIGGIESYQPGDTCVTETCRGKGIFTQMTKKSIEMLPNEAVIYNFPNQNSYPGYMKMGWKLIGEYYLLPLLCTNHFIKEHPDVMDLKYAAWWLEPEDSFFSVKRGENYFIVRKLSKKFCYQVAARVEKEVAVKYPKKPIGICFYHSKKRTFYNKNIGIPLHVVAKLNGHSVNIPLWKMDVI